MSAPEILTWEEQETLQFVGDFLGLAAVTIKLANHFYDANHQPKMDVTYRPDLKAFNALDWQPVSDELNRYETVHGLSDWLQSRDVDQMAKYAAGGSAAVHALRLKDGRIKMLRIGHGFHSRDFKTEDHTRLNVPQVLQHEAMIDTLRAQGYGHLSESVAEILPAVPVLPNDIAGIQIVPGHNTYNPNPLERSIVSENQWRRLEDQKLTLCAFFNSQGFRATRVADIGVLPDGTPIFVDPDTLKEGSRRPEVAGARVHNLLRHLGSGLEHLECYKWLDDPVNRRDPMQTAKQFRFFPV